MNNITALRNELSKIFDGLLDGTVQAKDAVELNNTAGKIINTLKVQLVYAALRKETPDIAFLHPSEGDTARPAIEGGARRVVGKRAPATINANEARA